MPESTTAPPLSADDRVRVRLTADGAAAFRRLFGADPMTDEDGWCEWRWAALAPVVAKLGGAAAFAGRAHAVRDGRWIYDGPFPVPSTTL